MFNNTVRFPETLEVNINNKRAPTDDSVRVFHEMREAAIQSILASGREEVSVGMLRWVVVDRPEYYGAELVFFITVNGKEHEGKVKMDRMKLALAGSSPQAQCDMIEELMLKAIHAVVTQAIRAELIRQAAYRISAAVLKC